MRFDSSLPLSLTNLLTEAVCDLAVTGKREAMLTHKLVRTLPTPVYTRTKKGTDADESGTRTAYEMRWKHFHAFCVLVGKYTCSLVLDRDECPDSPIPVEIDTIRLYISYMTLSLGTLLLHPETQVVIKDVMGNPVYCTASWHAPGNLTKFRAAMLGLDTLHAELTGPGYLEKCKECSLNTERSNGRGTRSRARSNVITHAPCDLHTDGARVRSRGSTVNSPKVILFVACTLNTLKEYKKKGNIQLLPSEVRRIRTALLAENSLHGLQYWTMVIMGIKLFLRISELLTIKIEDFDPELMMLESTTSYVSAMAVEIKGKGGKLHSLTVFADDVYPELCPVRALLLYISLSGITKGFIFPKFLPCEVPTVATTDDASTESTEDDEESTLHYPYVEFIRKMKFLLTSTLGREMGPQDIFGTHILRKTAYLFAIFGMLRQYGGEVSNLHDLLMTSIMQSARHATIMNVRYYSLDASTRYEWDKAKRVRTENEVPNWRSIHIVSTNVIRAATETSRAHQQHLSKIALVYLEKYLGFTVQVPVTVAVEKAFFQVQLTTAIESSADLHVKERLSVEDYKDYLEKKQLDIGNNPPVVPVVPSVPNPSTATSNQSYENPLRPTLGGKSKLQRIQIIGAMYESDKGRRPCTFKSGYKTFYYTKVKPVGLCLAHCFLGDCELFDQALDKLPNRGTYICCSDKLCKTGSI